MLLCYSQTHAAQLKLDPTYANENGPPPEGGMVDTDDAKFYFLSDVEDSTLQPDGQPTDAANASTESAPLPISIPWVRNVNDRDLTFIWEDQKIYRIARENPLPHNAVESYPHSVCGYYLLPKSELLYTQQQRRVTTSSYLMQEDPSRPRCKIVRGDSLWSSITGLWSSLTTSYRDENDMVRQVSMTITSDFDGENIIYTIYRNTDALGIGLSGLQDALTTSPSAGIVTESVAKDYGLTLQVSTLHDHLLQDELEQLPPSLQEKDFWIFSGGQSQKSDFEFWVPIKDFSVVAQSIESAAIFDKAGNLITMGPVALYLPHNE